MHKNISDTQRLADQAQEIWHQQIDVAIDAIIKHGNDFDEVTFRVWDLALLKISALTSAKGSWETLDIEKKLKVVPADRPLSLKAFRSTIQAAFKLYFTKQKGRS